MRKLIVLTTALVMTLLLQACGGSAGLNDPTSADNVPLSTADDGSAPTITFTGFAVVQVDGALSGKVVAFFSEDMDPATINTQNFIVTGPDGKAVAGTMLYIGVTAVFTPNQRFTAETRYTATISTGVRSLSGVPMARAKVFHFTTPNPSELTGVLVRVASSYPSNYEMDVPLDTGINATFNQVMDPATVNDSTFSVIDPSGAKVPGSVHYTGLTASFVPATRFSPSTTYRAVISSEVTNLAGISMDSDQHWSFTTSDSAAGVPPQVLSTAPMLGDSNVSLSGVVVADFNEPMDTNTINTGSFTVRDAGGNLVDGSVSYTGYIAVFTPAGPLQPQAVYTATVSAAAQSAGGTALAGEYSWTFTTGSAAVTGPTVLFTSPSQFDDNAPLGNAISVAFDQTLDPSTATAANVQVVAQDGSVVSGTVTCQGSVLLFTPDQSLQASTSYRVMLSPGIRSMAGGYLGQEYSWGFTTMAPVSL